MFWKRKKTASDLFSVESSNRRESFRIKPPEDEPIFIQLKNQRISLIDIGALGFSFNNTDFSKDDEYNVDFYLKGHIKKISAGIEIIGIDSQDICHCSFKTLNEEEFEAIHQYMLDKQKDLKRGVG